MNGFLLAIRNRSCTIPGGRAARMLALAMLIAVLAVPAAHAARIRINPVTPDPLTGELVPLAGTGFKWLVQEDAMFAVEPGVTCQDGDPATCPSVSFHRSYIPVVRDGDSTDPVARNLNRRNRYYVSILPAEGYALGGAPAVFPADATGNTEISVDVVVQPYPIPTAQIRVFVFEDGGPGSVAPLNNAPDAGEPGLAGWRITLEEPGGKYGIPGGQVMQDAFGNPVGSSYDSTTGDLLVSGSGQLVTGDDGFLQIKNLAPAKYGIIVTPERAAGCPSPDRFGRTWTGTGAWQQTTTIEGSPVIDAWVKANEPPFFVEFGPPGPHVFVGFSRDCRLAPGQDSPFGDTTDPQETDPGTTLSGTITNLHLNRPPDFGFDSGNNLAECYIGINEMSVGTGESIYAGPCDTSQGSEGNSDFTVEGLRDGAYQIAVLDANLLVVIGLQNVLIQGGQCSRDNGLTFGSCSLGEVPAFNWFGRHEHTVFLDRDKDGFRDPDEPGMLEQNINLRFRDGTVYQAFPTDLDGFAPFDAIFPFFHWQVTEVDFGRFQSTGLTVVTDAGGTIPADNGWTMPSRDILNPQPQFCTQADVDDGVLADEIAGTPCALGAEIINPNTGNNLSRTYTGTVLTMGVQTFLGQTNVFEWGKFPYDPKNPAAGNNGGVSGIVFYAITRAEDDPRYAAGEEWEPGIPRIQMALYADSDGDGQIDDLDGDAAVTPADVDNYPFGNFPRNNGTISREDKDWNGNGLFDYGDAIQISTTDSWDDSLPTGCQGDVFYVCASDWPADVMCHPDSTPAGYTGAAPAATDCYDGLRNYNQVRPAVFDGGYAFESYYVGGMSSHLDVDGNLLEAEESAGLLSGEYIVETGWHPVYEVLKEEDRNVDFGDEYTPSALLLPATCVGEDHLVPNELALFPGEPAFYGGQTRKLCDRKLVAVKNGSNTAADFWMFTEVPIGAQLTGFILDDLANEFDPNAPTFGEKYSPPFIPVAFFDWAGEEIARTYSDRWGKYNAVVPSTFSANLPMPSGMAPNMLTACMNHPGPVDNPAFNPELCAEGVVNDPPEDPETDCVNGAQNPDYDPRLTVMDPYFKRQYSQFCYVFQYMPGSTTYLDTPVVPVAAFAGPGSEALDCESPDGTPVIYSVSDKRNGIGGGPYILERTNGPARYNNFDVISMGTVQVPNPNWDGATAGQQLIDRDFGFGDNRGDVFIGSVQLANNQVGWSNDLITIKRIAVGSLPADARQLRIIRADTGRETVQGVTLTFEGDLPAGASALSVAPGGSIQAVIDTARAGDLILVPSGSYEEMVIMSKPLLLQGWGSGSVTINASHVPAEKLFDWRRKIANLRFNEEFDILPGQEPGVNVGLERTVFNTDEGPGVIVVSKNRGPAAAFQPGYGRLCADGSEAGRTCSDGSLPRPNARIDGLGITGATQGGGIFVNGYARWLQIGNNRITGNQGTYGGGIRLGHPFLGFENPNGTLVQYTDAQNNNVRIFNNHVKENGGQGGFGGGISINSGADNYKVTENLVCGNFSQGDGGGIGHNGFSRNGLIADNTVIFNQSFNQGLQKSGGGIFIGGGVQLLGEVRTEGSGSVLVDANLIQGNLAGAGDGGGIRLERINGQDVADNSGPWLCFECQESEGGECTSWESIEDEAGVVPCLWHGACRNLTALEAQCSDLPPDDNAARAPFEGWSMIRIFNNIVADNVSGLAGAGVSIDNAAFADIENNTIVNNDAVGTAGVAFQKPNESAYQPAGVVSREHAGDLNGLLAPVRALFPFSTRFSTFSDPRLYNNLIQHNRSFKYVQCAVAPMDPLLYAAECISGELASDFKGLYPVADTTGSNHRYWDLSVADLPGEFLNPRSSILSTTENGAPINMAPYHASNSTSDADHHIQSYFNGEPGQTIIQTEGTVIAVTPAFDEGGNFIDVRYSPLSLLDSDYHLAAGSTAIDSGDASVIPGNCFGTFARTALCLDVDGESRDGVIVDVGADELGGISPASFFDGGVAVTTGDTTDETFATDTTGTEPAPGDAVDPDLMAGDTTGTGGTATDGGVTAAGSGTATTLAFGDCVPGEGVCDCLDLWGPNGDPWGNTYEAGERCMHIGGGDGYSWMSTGYLDPLNNQDRLLYGFSFRDLTGTIGGGLNVDESPAFEAGFIGAEFPAPSIVLEEGDQFYLHLSNVGMAIRPDLFDPHTVHWHGFPEASAVFDGVPDASISINMFATLTYYYNVVKPGTYMYHCHVEATEHMQMGMMGNLYVHAAQDTTGYDADNDGLPDPGTILNPAGTAGYVYNDGDGSSYYDKEYPIQLMSFDGDFHNASETVQPLPFALMDDDYALINGRGYPATVDAANLSHDARGALDAPKESQRVSSLITATVGEKVLLRVSNLSVTKQFTLAVLGLPMQVVGRDARLFRGKGGQDLYYVTSSVTLGGGESRDILIDTADVAPGRYFLYTTNMNYLSNSDEDYGGMMTEIVIEAAAVTP